MWGWLLWMCAAQSPAVAGPGAGLLTEVGADLAPGSVLRRELAHLRVLGSVLYVAAHPDDENTRLLGWAVGARGLEATYVSLTRGGGGQNLVGTQQGASLGVLRTGELIAARSIDGAHQRFTRARDAGYSRSTEDALAMWGHEAVLEDLVRVVREVQPDVILTRFGPNDQSHGHHTASAVLAAEAMVAAADDAYRQVSLPPWSADRLLRNESHWRMTEDTDTSGWIAVDVGGLDAASGRTFNEISAQARSQHASQGFGSSPRLEPTVEYFSGVAGQVPAVGEDLFAGLDLSWGRVAGGAAVDKALAKALKRFDPAQPHLSVPALTQALAVMTPVAETSGLVVAEQAVLRLRALILACAGVKATLRSPTAAVVPGGELDLTLTAWAMSGHAVGLSIGKQAPLPLGGAEPAVAEVALALPDTTPVTVPHWLKLPPSEGGYAIEETWMRTVANRAAYLTFPVTWVVGDQTWEAALPVVHAWTDPVLGAQQRAVEVLPQVTITPTGGPGARYVPQGTTAQVGWTVALTQAPEAPVTVEVRLAGPAGAQITPERQTLQLSAAQPAQTVHVQVALAAGQDGPDVLQAEVTLGDRTEGWAVEPLDVPHLPARTLLSPAQVPVSAVALDRGGVQRVGYVMGSGDAVPGALTDLGYTVVPVAPEALAQAEALADLDVLVFGVRALNTQPAVVRNLPAVYDWVADGGRLVMQYNTSNRWRDLGDVGPPDLTLRIGRDRVTDEAAVLDPLVEPDHPVLAGPNALTAEDLASWVQERGLYFAQTWGPGWQPIFRSHDPGYDPLDGGLLMAPHGQGVVTYTGLSFFRQFPAGVAGPARLFANVLAVSADALRAAEERRP